MTNSSRTLFRNLLRGISRDVSGTMPTSALTLVLIVLTASRQLLGQAANQRPAPQESPKTALPAEAKAGENSNVLLQLNSALEALAAKVSPAVVQILVTGFGPVRQE